MNWSILNALKGTGGEFEVNRVLGAAGVTIYIISVPSFVVWNMARGAAFDIVAYCGAYSAGLGVAIGAIAGAVSVKDRNVATSRATIAKTESDTADAQKYPPNERGATDGPQPVEVVNAPDNPVPTETIKGKP